MNVHEQRVQFSVHSQFMNVHEQELRDFHEQFVPYVHEWSWTGSVQFSFDEWFMNIHELNDELW